MARRRDLGVKVMGKNGSGKQTVFYANEDNLAFLKSLDRGFKSHLMNKALSEFRRNEPIKTLHGIPIVVDNHKYDYAVKSGITDKTLAASVSRIALEDWELHQVIPKHEGAYSLILRKRR